MRRAASGFVAAVGALAGALLLAVPPPARSEEGAPLSEVSASPPPAVPDESYPALHIIGFTDVDYFVMDEPKTPESSVFEGQFVLHFVSVLSRRFTF